MGLRIDSPLLRLACLLASCPTLASCSVIQPTVQVAGGSPAALAEPSEVNALSLPASAERRTRVVVDSRIELLSVVQILSGYFLASRLETDYKADVQRFFAAHADHRAVSIFKEMSRKDFQFSEVPTAIYAFTSPPELSRVRSLPASTVQAAGGPDQLAELIAAMREFYRDSGFESFSARHATFYQSAIEHSSPAVQEAATNLEAYLGTPLVDATVILGPLLHDGGFAASYPKQAGKSEIVSFIGPEKVTDGRPDFGTPERIGSLISHEFAHSVINPITSRHSAEVERRSRRFEAIRSNMLENGYGTWEQSVYEHVIRAITARLAGMRRGAAAEKAAVDDELKRGFVYVPELIERLKFYEGRRVDYPTIEAYFPVLLQAFDTEVVAAAEPQAPR